MRIGYVGLGLMGAPMARRVLAQQHELAVWNRDPRKAQELQREGANHAASAAEVMAAADIVGLCLTSDAAVEAVAFGEQGLFSAERIAGKIIVDFSTCSPEAARWFAERAQSHGVDWIDAPVSGGVPGAEAGTLVVLAGGSENALARAAPLLQAVAARVTHIGPSGAGQVAKLCSQLIVSCNVLLLAETYALGRKSGIDVGRLVEAFRGGFADSKPLQIFGPRMAHHEFEPILGAIAMMRKDVELVAQLANKTGSVAPLLQRAQEIYATPGLDLDKDLSGLICLYEKDL